MASAQGIRAGRAFVELFADDSKLVRGLRAAERKLKAFGDSIRGLGLKMIGVGSAILAPLAASAKLFGSFGDSVAKMARRTGLSVEALSELQFAAGQSGVEVSELENGLRRMQRTIYDAGRGLSTSTDALKDLGLTADDLAGLSPEDQFKLLAERISQIEDPTLKAALAMQVFGRSGTELLPLFASGARGIEMLQAEARRLGLTMSGEDAKAAEAFSDALDRLWQVVKMGVFNIGAALAPTLKMVAEKIMRVAMVVSAWIKKNQQIIVTVLKVAAVVVAVGIAMTVLGTIISGLGTMLGVLITVVTTVVAVLKVLASVIAFLISPIGLVIAAVAALGAYLVYATDIGAKALAWLGDRFKVLKDDALSAYQGIADALAAGDIALAVKILWLTIKMEWTRGVNFLEKAWLQFRGFFIKIGYDTWHGVQAAWEIVGNNLMVAWINLSAMASTIWVKITSGFAQAWHTAITWTEKRLHELWGQLDRGYDVQAAKTLADQGLAATREQMDRDTQTALAAREKQRVGEQTAAAQIHQQNLARIGQANLDRHRALDDDYERRLAENEAELAKARQAWQDAIQEARDRTIEPQEDDVFTKFRDALAGLSDIGDLIQQEAAKIGVKGTFNAAPGSLLGLQGSSDLADRTAKATEETARNTKRLLQAAQAGGMIFQ